MVGGRSGLTKEVDGARLTLTTTFSWETNLTYGATLKSKATESFSICSQWHERPEKALAAVVAAAAVPSEGLLSLSFKGDRLNSLGLA
ncbi:hypothetical protein ACLOJK_026416 [Asimina triloba]